MFAYIPGFINVMDKYETLNEEVVQCPKHLVEIAAHLDSDPDPYFDAAYNWYYSGSGNLQLICIDWVDYLLHSEFTAVCELFLHEPLKQLQLLWAVGSMVKFHHAVKQLPGIQ